MSADYDLYETSTELDLPVILASVVDPSSSVAIETVHGLRSVVQGVHGTADNPRHRGEAEQFLGQLEDELRCCLKSREMRLSTADRSEMRGLADEISGLRQEMGSAS